MKKFMSIIHFIRTISLIQIEWNIYNGFILDFLNIITNNHDRSLFALNISKNFIMCDILFFNFVIYQSYNI